MSLIILITTVINNNCPLRNTNDLSNNVLHKNYQFKIKLGSQLITFFLYVTLFDVF